MINGRIRIGPGHRCRNRLLRLLPGAMAAGIRAGAETGEPGGNGCRHAASRAEGGGGADRGRLDHAGAVSGRSGGRGAAPAALVVVMSLPAGWIAVAAVLALLLGLCADAGGPGHAATSRPGRRQDGIARPGDAHIAPPGADRQAGSPHQNGWHDHRRGMEIRRGRSGRGTGHRWACYFLLIEEELRIRPSHGFIVCGDGTRHRIENDDELRAWVLDLAGQIRQRGRRLRSRSRSTRCRVNAAHVYPFGRTILAGRGSLAPDRA